MIGADVDYATLVKLYGPTPDGAAGTAQSRHGPGACVGLRKIRVEGRPARRHVSTSYAERHNLSMRMGNRRVTRLTNALSKKAEAHPHAMSIYFTHYNFVRTHQTLGATPAMEAGVTDRLWELGDLVAALEEWEDNQQAGSNRPITRPAGPRSDASAASRGGRTTGPTTRGRGRTARRRGRARAARAG